MIPDVHADVVHHPRLGAEDLETLARVHPRTVLPLQVGVLERRRFCDQIPSIAGRARFDLDAQPARERIGFLDRVRSQGGDHLLGQELSCRADQDGDRGDLHREHATEPGLRAHRLATVGNICHVDRRT